MMEETQSQQHYDKDHKVDHKEGEGEGEEGRREGHRLIGAGIMVEEQW